jgi:tRNA modification GTPase
LSVSDDTIVAVSSPPGPGLRAVVRLSGPRAAELGASLPGAVHLRAPRTYTREEVVEVHLPGATPLVERLVRELAERGARLARPGEFTLRAFLNGRLDLAQAEAVERVIASEDAGECRAALAQLGGAFSRRLRAIEEDLLDLCADAEAAIDFVDQDIEILTEGEARRRAAAGQAELEALLAESAAVRVTDGRPVVALYGRPNAGKSSLFNALTGSDALVADEAGTTRDVLLAGLDVGFPVALLDTAGQREGAGLEAAAARRGGDAARAADAVLFVVDATDPEASVPLEPRGRPAILVINKCDLASGEGVRRRFHMRESVCTSARTGQGLEELKSRLRDLLDGGEAGAGARFRVNSRQHALLREARAAMERAASTAAGLGMEFVALDLRAALDALGGITGRQVGEDLLDHVFSRFCLGK